MYDCLWLAIIAAGGMLAIALTDILDYLAGGRS
jgi:hypothetical protein